MDVKVVVFVFGARKSRDKSKPQFASQQWSSELGVNPGIQKLKNHLSELACGQKAIGGIYFTNKWKA